MNNTPTEYEEQKTLVAYLEARGLKFTAIPNSTFTQSWAQKMKNKQSGVRAGLPDVLVIIPGRGLLFIEMKRRIGGQVSKAQREWIDALNELDGVEAVVCKGCEEAIKLIEEI